MKATVESLKLLWGESKPDSVFTAIYLCPLLDAPVRMVIAHHSEVAAGRIARFTPTRLCCSQVLSFQDLFQTPHVDKEFGHYQVGAYAPSPPYCCLDFPLQSCLVKAVAVLPPRAIVSYQN